MLLLDLDVETYSLTVLRIAAGIWMAWLRPGWSASFCALRSVVPTNR